MHFSCVSHGPETARQVVFEETNASAGQAATVPLQASWVSQTPLAARHAIVVAENVSAGHPAALPVQRSATSHTPAEARHTVVDASYWQLALQQSPPAVFPSSHCSPASTLALPHDSETAARAAFTLSRPYP